MLEKEQKIEKFSIFTNLPAIIIFLIVMLTVSLYLYFTKGCSAELIVVVDFVILLYFSFAQDTEIEGGGDSDADPIP